MQESARESCSPAPSTKFLLSTPEHLQNKFVSFAQTITAVQRQRPSQNNCSRISCEGQAFHIAYRTMEENHGNIKTPNNTKNQEGLRHGKERERRIADCMPQTADQPFLGDQSERTGTPGNRVSHDRGQARREGGKHPASCLLIRC